MAETFRAFAAPPGGVVPRLRRAARGALLDALALAPPRPGARFVRPLFAHYVFDDQRRAFEAIVRDLKGIGEFVATDALLDMVSGRVPVDGRYLHLSFDDGLACLYRNARPILAEAGVPWTVFVNSAMAAAEPAAEDEARWRRGTNYAGPVAAMGWGELRTLQAEGVTIGAHTRSHVRLSAVSGEPARLAGEVAGCRAEIEAALGAPCRDFAVPFGRDSDIDRTALAAVEAAGYRSCFGNYRRPLVPGRTSPLAIPRHHFEPHWPRRHVRLFARGGLERAA